MPPASVESARRAEIRSWRGGGAGGWPLFGHDDKFAGLRMYAREGHSESMDRRQAHESASSDRNGRAGSVPSPLGEPANLECLRVFHLGILGIAD